MSFSQTLFGFKGRIARLPYLGYSLLGGLFVGIFLFMGFAVAASAKGASVLGILIIAAAVIGYAWIALALQIKRLHDLGFSGLHMIWIAAIGALSSALSQANPTISIILGFGSLCVWLWLLFAPGQPETNAYGPPPGTPVPQPGYAPPASPAY